MDLKNEGQSINIYFLQQIELKKLNFFRLYNNILQKVLRILTSLALKNDFAGTFQSHNFIENLLNSVFFKE